MTPSGVLSHDVAGMHVFPVEISPMVMKNSTKQRARRPTDAEERFRHDVVRRLNAMVNLLTMVGPESRSMTERIHLLADCGLSPAEIVDVVGKGANYVGAVLARKKGANE